MALTATTSVQAITCVGGTTTLTVNASGGIGSYHYSLSNGTTTTGPQNDNQFTVSAGNYTLTITDDNSCVSNTGITIADGSQVCNGFASAKQASSNDNSSTVIKNNELKVDVSPNPTAKYFSLKIETNSNEKIKMLITDLYGKELYQCEGGNCSKKSILGENFKPGIYFIKIIQGEHSKTLRLIKQ